MTASAHYTHSISSYENKKEENEEEANGLLRLHHRLRKTIAYIGWITLRIRKSTFLSLCIFILTLFSIYIAYRATQRNHYNASPGGQSAFPFLPREAKQGDHQSVWSYQGPRTMTETSCRLFRQKLRPLAVSPRRRATHLEAAIGRPDLFPSNCLTYGDRFHQYTDTALRIDYRSLVTDTDDPLLGPIRPLHFTMENWSSYLQSRNSQINNQVDYSKGSIGVPDWKALSEGCGLSKSSHPKVRTAIVLRLYEGYVFTEDEVLNLRAMLTEVDVLNPRDGFDVRILVEIKKTKGALILQSLQEKVLTPMLPREFWRLCEFWSDDLVKALVPDIAPKILDGYKGMCLVPTQMFSKFHPEYDFVYNWEADVRFLGNYKELFKNAQEFARQEPTSNMLQKYRTWLVRGSKRSEQNWAMQKSQGKTGVGKEADLLTFNAIIDVKGSGWVHAPEYDNYSPAVDLRTSIVSTLRMSKALLKAMSLVMIKRHKSLRCEMWPATIALHGQMPPSDHQSFDQNLAEEMGSSLPFKTVFFPHPVYLDQNYPPAEIESTINRLDFFKNQDFMGHSSFNWECWLAPEIYQNWRIANGTDACRLPSLMHPIKNVGY